MERFSLDAYLSRQQSSADEKIQVGDGAAGLEPVEKWTFEGLCSAIQQNFMQEWDDAQDNLHAALQMQKRAIIGYENEVAYFKEKIAHLVRLYGAEHVKYPAWYNSLVDGIYHENWGMAGISQWFDPSFRDSSSAKVIGERIYFLEDGKMNLKPQRISKDRREQLIRAFLLLTPEERLDKEFHEVYLLDGTRITVFGGVMTKQNQDTIIFRRYIVPNYSFEEQARRHTIPMEAIPLFEAMVEVGYSIAVTGAVRTAKTTFLSTWQSYEDPNLEGVMVETDPEIPLHLLMPDAPIVQLIADNEKLSHIAKNLLRSDADYFILAEARDGVALDTAVRIATKGTKRMKITFHTREPLDFCRDVASEIIKAVGGDLAAVEQKVACSFDYIFHFVQLKNKNQKRLSGIYELWWDREKREVSMARICKYHYLTDDWIWDFHLGADKQQIGEEENIEALNHFSQTLTALSKK